MDATHAERGALGGKVSGPFTSTNFKNDKKLASRAGKLSKPGPWPQCDICGKKMAKSKIEKHLTDEHKKGDR